MSVGITQDSNGLSYDFGVAIAQGAAGALATMAIQVATITGSIYALIDAGNASDNMLRKNQLAMGGYNNFLKSVDYFSEKVASGQSYFDVDNLMEGAKQLQHAGLDVKKNFDLINKSAQGIGSDFSALSTIIRNGDYSALAEAGLITDRMATNMQRTTFTQEQGTRRILALLKQADTKGLFEGNIATLAQTTMRIKQIYSNFMSAIIGDLKDPEGFWNILKKAMADFADFFAKRMDKIVKIGQFVGKILSFIVRSVSGFVRFMGKVIGKVLGNTDDFFSNWQEKMYSFSLWLEILRIKVAAFFEFWGPLVFKIWAVNSALNAVWMTGAGLNKTFRVMRILASGKGGLLANISGSGTIAKLVRIGTIINTMIIPGVIGWGTATWAALAPVILTVATLAAVAVSLGLLVYYWDDIRKYTNSVSDKMLLIISVISPLVGIVMIISKYWNETKTIVGNLVNIARNLLDILISVGTVIVNYLWGNLKKTFNWFKNILKSVDGWMTSTFGDAWLTIKSTFFDPIEKAFKFVKGLISDAFNFDLGDSFNKVIEWTKSFADKTADSASNMAKVAGRKSFAKQGSTLAMNQKKEVLRLIAEGKNDEEIMKQMDNGNFDKGILTDARKEQASVEPIKKLEQRPAGTTNNNGGSSTQVNHYNIKVENATDVDKVVAAVEKSNKKKADIDNRRKGN